ncbi:MAG: FHA domain-containing protein [Chitinophagales bacterium]|nr:FHA domain-containing protein [Chitinophagales bacterium]
MRVTLGRATTNNYTTDDPSVSNSHAYIEFDDTHIFIHDTNSANGTFVNNIQIIKKEIDLTNQIKLGNHLVDNKLLNQIIHQQKVALQTDFTKEFQELEPVYNQYIKNLNKIDTSEKNRLILIRLVITAVLMLLVFLIFGKPSYMIFVGLIATMLTNFLIKPSNVREKKEDIQLNLSDDFVCPKCKTSLANKSWKYWKKNGVCPNSKCNATWQ